MKLENSTLIIIKESTIYKMLRKREWKKKAYMVMG
jgi:hypothetical protein